LESTLIDSGFDFQLELKLETFFSSFSQLIIENQEYFIAKISCNIESHSYAISLNLQLFGLILHLHAFVRPYLARAHMAHTRTCARRA
jgi:hypothetical protein